MTDLSTTIAGVKFPSCFMNAAGALCVTRDELVALGKSRAGAIVTKSMTVEARQGNPEPRYYGFPGGSINSMGLPNLGYRAYAELIPELKQFGKPVIASVAGLCEDDFPMIAATINAAKPDLIEVNLSCMSPTRADRVNAVELAGRAATLEPELRLGDLPRLAEAGALDGTQAQARLGFGSFEGRPTVQMQVEGRLVLLCQRCLRPCDCRVSESAMLMIVADEGQEVAGGYEPVSGDPERLSVVELIEEQLLLGIPLVRMHEDEAQCRGAPRERVAAAADAPMEDRQRPFANLREVLDKGE